MLIEDYTEIVLLTEPEFRDYLELNNAFDIPKMRTLHGSMGLITKVTELHRLITRSSFEVDSKKLAEDAGDCLWYASLLALSLDFPLKDFLAWHFDSPNFGMDKRSLVDDMLSTSGKLLDFIKRSTFRGIPYDRAKALHKIDRIFFICSALVCSAGYSIESVLDLNRKKLSLKYPSKFRTLSLRIPEDV